MLTKEQRLILISSTVRRSSITLHANPKNSSVIILEYMGNKKVIHQLYEKGANSNRRKLVQLDE